MKHFLLIMSLFVHLTTTNAQNWNISQFGPAPKLLTFDLIVGEGRNDSLNRVYVTTKDGNLYEWTYDPATSKWKYISVASGLKGLTMIDMGKARNDGKNRLYVTEFTKGGRVMEFEWNGTAWKTNIVDTGPHSLTVVVGNGRNDGKDYLYVGSTDVGIWEYAYNGTTWDKTQMHFQAAEGVGVIGESRNDGVSHLILNSNDVKEYTWDGTKYTIATPSPKIEWPDAIHLGKGRNDGINRIYANCFAGRGRVEYTWNGTSWTSTTLNPFQGRGDIYTAAVQKDGLTRIYTTTSEYFKGPAGSFKEYQWNKTSSTFDSSIILDAKSGATAMVVAGFGRNDDTMRLYATNYVAGTVYEITHKSPYTKTKVGVRDLEKNGLKANIYPNPVLTDAHYSIENPDGEYLTLELLNFTGEVLQPVARSSERKIEGSLSLTPYSEGLYYLRISSGSGQFVRQLVKLK